MSKVQAAPSKVRAEMTAISEKQRQGRAANAVAELLMRKLLVPKIFLESKGWIFPGGRTSSLRTIDLLAVDRAGSGDVHVVEFKLGNPGAFPDPTTLTNSIKMLLDSIPAHFKYLAVGSGSLEYASRQQLFAKNGIGRVGIIEIVERDSEPPEARIAIQAERFRVEPSWIKKFDSFQKRTPADMEIRD